MSIREDIVTALKKVYDPEMPVNIYELGLIYDLTVDDAGRAAVRTGHHCAQPVMDRYQIPATTRASFAFYNTTAEIDSLVDGLHKVKEIFS